MSHKKTTDELVAERPGPQELKNLSRTPVVVIADNIRSLDNVGLLFRLCELSRTQKLYLTGYTGYPRDKEDKRLNTIIERNQNRISKTAVYAIEHQPWEYHEDPVPVVQALKKDGYQIVALEQTDSSIPYAKASYAAPTAIIVGHERLGVRTELLDMADDIIEIPIMGLGNSHNAAIATGIVLYHILNNTGQLE